MVRNLIRKEELPILLYTRNDDWLRFIYLLIEKNIIIVMILLYNTLI